jgi:hypothetical protein
MTLGVYGGINVTEIDKSQRNWDANRLNVGRFDGGRNDVDLPTEPTRQEKCNHVINHLPERI